MPEQYISPLGAVVGAIDAYRKQQRDLEDQDLDRKIALVHDLITGPGANPARTAEGLKAILQLQSAKGGRGKAQAGLGGFLGKHEEVMPDLLAQIIHGTIPIEGPTQEPIPPPPSLQAQGLLPKAAPIVPQGPSLKDFSGQTVLQDPPIIPPPPFDTQATGDRMLSAARDMQKYNEGPKTRPVAVQPMKKSFEEQAQEAATAGAMKSSAALKANMEAEFDTLVKMGHSPELARTAVAEKYGLKPMTTAFKPGTGKTYALKDAAGNIIDLEEGFPQLQRDGTFKVMNQQGTPLPEGYQPLQNTAAKVPNAMQMAAKELFGTTDLNSLDHDQATKLRNFINSDKFAEFDKRAREQSALGLSRAWASPAAAYETPDPNNPGQTTLVTVPKSAQRPGGGVGAAGAGAGSVGNPPTTIAPPPKATKLNQDEQRFYDDASASYKSGNRVLQLLESSGMANQNTMKAWMSQGGQNALYSLGIKPSELNEEIIQRTGFIQALALRALMGGRQSKYLAGIFNKHLPQTGFMTPARLYQTLKLVQQEMVDRKTAIEDRTGMKLKPWEGEQGGTQSSGQQGAGLSEKDLDAFVKSLQKPQKE